MFRSREEAVHHEHAIEHELTAAAARSKSGIRSKSSSCSEAGNCGCCRTRNSPKGPSWCIGFQALTILRLST